jgi:hypothetical protein
MTSPFERQLVAAVAAQCRPNSEKEERHWACVPRDVRRFSGDVIDRLVRSGFLERRGQSRDSWMLRPTARGAEVAAEERRARRDRKRRPPFFDSVVFEVPALRCASRNGGENVATLSLA